MVEPHVFCGPEFFLQADATQAAAVLAGQTDALVQLQRDIFDVCTAQVRRRVHLSYLQQQQQQRGAKMNTAISVSSMVPAAPGTLFFVAVTPVQSLSPSEQASVQQSRKALGLDQTQHVGETGEGIVYTVLLLTDSRIAAEVYMLLLRRGALALSAGCRLFLYYRATARAAPPPPRAELLARREAQQKRMNLDEDLWSALQDGLSEELVQRVLTAEVGDRTQLPHRLLTRAEEHEQKVRRLLHYCEHSVQYAGVLDEKENASPFLLAMGLFAKLQLTTEDLLRSFVRHPRRVIRALALFLARYLVAPEEVMAFFAPCMQDAVVIACAADAAAAEACAMRDVALDLLRKEELNEAWLPVYHPYWLSHVIEPGIAAAMAPPSTTSAEKTNLMREESEEKNSNEVAEGRAGVVPEDTPLGPVSRKRGRGVAASLGFRSIAALASFARQQSTAMPPQRLSTVLARHRRAAQQYDEEDDGDEDSVGDDGSESSEEHLIHVDIAPGAEVKADNNNNNNTSNPWLAGQAAPQEGDASNSSTRGGAAAAAATARNAVRRGADDGLVNAHAAAMAQGSALLLALLGRTRPFDRNDPHYLRY